MEKYDITSLRILFIRIVLSFIERDSGKLYLGQMKSLLALAPLPDYADVIKFWEIDFLFNYLKPKTRKSDILFLKDLLRIINDNSNIYEIKSILEWKKTRPVTLARVWE